MPEWRARLHIKTGKVLCGYPRCSGHLGYVAIDSDGLPNGLQLPAGFEPLSKPGTWRLSNYSRGRRPESDQPIRLRGEVASDVAAVGGRHKPLVAFPVRVYCPECNRLNIAEPDALKPPVEGVLD